MGHELVRRLDIALKVRSSLQGYGQLPPVTAGEQGSKLDEFATPYP